MRYLERIFTTRSHRYFVLTLSVFSLLGLLCGYLLLGESRQQYRYLQQYQTQLEQQLVVLTQQDNQLSVQVSPGSVFTPQAFSLLETLRQARGQLIHWQPDEHQARLELTLPWERVPHLFRHIAYYHGLNLTSFQISGGADIRAVVLALEFSYENP